MAHLPSTRRAPPSSPAKVTLDSSASPARTSRAVRLAGLGQPDRKAAPRTRSEELAAKVTKPRRRSPSRWTTSVESPNERSWPLASSLRSSAPPPSPMASSHSSPVEGHGRSVEGNGRQWKALEPQLTWRARGGNVEGQWKAMEGHGRPWTVNGSAQCGRSVEG